MSGKGILGCGIALVVLALAPAAQAATRYASPLGGVTGAEPCVRADPCTLTNAIQGHVPADIQNGDEVIVLGGLGPYNPGTQINVSKPIDIGGEPGAPVPVINAAGTLGIDLQVAATIHDLRIDKAAGTAALFLDGINPGAVAERVFVTYAGATPGAACRVVESAVIRNSVCWASGASGAGVDNGGGIVDAKLRNVTAVGSGAGGIGIRMDSASSVTIEATNVIARGTSFDTVSQNTGAGSSSTLTLTNSNFSNSSTTGTAASTTPAGTNGNQTVAPLFANAAAGNFHELAGSPTIDAGVADPLLDGLDLDRTARSQATCLGGAPKPDIGAYEAAPPVASPVCSKFTIGTLTRNKKKGTATLTVNVPGAGTLTASGKSLKTATAAPTVAGDTTVKLKASGKAKRKLNDQGRAKLKLSLRWEPTGNTAATQTDKVKLKKRAKG
jgi:hypothetical protein